MHTTHHDTGALFPIYPSLLAFDFARLAEQVAVVEAAGAAALHFDLMDGQFVPNLTFGAMVLKALRPQSKLPFGAHLMVYNPEALIDGLADAGATRVYVHPEATPNIHRVLLQIREAGMEPALAINPGTPILNLEPLLEISDAVLVMSVNPGFGGQAFLPSAVGRVAQLCALAQQLGVSPCIECDGGVDAATIGPLVQAGMTGAVVGSALFRGADPATNLQQISAAAR
ncbi:MAG TPA: ribulose-phosphate 3-epimerase [Armatimonadota bacterium]